MCGLHASALGYGVWLVGNREVELRGSWEDQREGRRVRAKWIGSWAMPLTPALYLLPSQGPGKTCAFSSAGLRHPGLGLGRGGWASSMIVPSDFVQVGMRSFPNGNQNAAT